MRELDEAEYDAVWDDFYGKFDFKPSVDGPFPAIKEPRDSITFKFRENYTDSDIDNLAKSISTAFVECGVELEEVYYLDWQHDCYALAPTEIQGSWATGFPDGDYAIFLSKDMAFGTFGHPWENSICVFGDRFVKALLTVSPSILEYSIRNSGCYAEPMRQ